MPRWVAPAAPPGRWGRQNALVSAWMVVPSEGMAMGQGSLLRLKMLTTHTLSLLLQKHLFGTCAKVRPISKSGALSLAGAWLGSVTGGARTEGVRAPTERVGEGLVF